MPVTATVKVHLGETVTLLQSMARRASDLTPLLAGPLTNEVHQFFHDQFATSGAAGGTPWEPLSLATLAFKRRYGRVGMGTLRFSNTLWASLTKRGHPLGRRTVTPTSLEVGTNDPKAAKHQQGLEGLTVRELVPEELPDAYTNRWDSLILTYVTGE